jgi:hypothetical protein
MRKIIALLLVVTFTFVLSACSEGKGDEVESTDTGPVSVEYDRDDLDFSSSRSGMSHITLEGDTITLDGRGARVDGNTVTITSGGMYSISGTLNDGQIIVNTQDERTVKLVLNGADIACSTSSPIYVINAEKTVITLADGTENYITDGDSYVFEDAEADEPNATVFSKDDLTINGDGSLIVNSNYNNGIQSKDDLKITGGNITVNAVNDSIKGRDSIAIRGGNITLNAGGDGMQSTNNEDAGRGYISIENGTINITAGEDGIQAETRLIISGGDITISSGGGSIHGIIYSIGGRDTWGDNAGSSISSGSAKGLKSEIDVTITGGTINIDSADDSIHSNDSLTINGGDITLASGDDGIHSDSTLEISGGEINITTCYEGIESAVITINDGHIHLAARDDGINAVSGDDGFTVNARPGRDNFNVSTTNYLYINGGYTVIDATGDGLDVNGSIYMTGGVVLIDGPVSNMNGALDYLGACKVTGGYLVAAGSSGMAQAPDASSTQYSVMINFPSLKPAGTIVHIETGDGEKVFTFSPKKTYQSVVLCSSELEKGSTYVVYSGGNSTGTYDDGLYSGGTYTEGTQITSFTVSSMVTVLGSYGGGFPGGRRW